MGYSKLINRLIAAASDALYAKSELTVNMSICKEGASCCPLINDIHSYIQRQRAREKTKMNLYVEKQPGNFIAVGRK